MLKSLIYIILIVIIPSISYADNDVFPPFNFFPSSYVSYDSLNPPQQVTVFENKVAAYNRIYPQMWGRLTLQCLSNSSSQYGKCSTSPIRGENAPLYIPLDFTDSKTGNKVTINILLTKNPSTGSTNTITSPLNPFWASSYGVRFSQFIPSSEFIKFTAAGNYTAQLKMGLYNNSNDYGAGNVKINDWVTSFQIKVTDVKNQKIFFPEYPMSNPKVNLNLSYRPGVMSDISSGGSTTLDMCLYDGGISANNITMTFQDESKPAPGRENGRFSVYRNGGDINSTADRLDYELKVRNPVTGSIDNVSNGSRITWSSYNSKLMQRQVVLPGIPGISMCVPAPLFFITPSFNIKSKTAGLYAGRISVTYLPVTTINN